MPRRRLAVALIPPPALACTVDTLRRALGVPEPFPVPPHLTLVPPVNVRDEDLAGVVATMRQAARATDPFELRIGPAATFAPDSPTVHLEVAGGDGALEALRSRIRHGPLDRPDTWPFAAHVTLAESYAEDRIPAAVSVLGGVDERWTIEAVHLLEEERRADGSRFWQPVGEEPLGPAVVVGRGGVELVLRATGMIDAAAAAVCHLAPAGPALTPGPRPLTVSAEDGASGAAAGAGDPRELVGAAVGSTGPDGVARLEALAVVADRRGEGIGRQVLAAWCSAAADRDCAVVLVDGDLADAARAFALDRGFVAAGGVLVRSLR